MEFYFFLELTARASRHLFAIAHLVSKRSNGGDWCRGGTCCPLSAQEVWPSHQQPLDQAQTGLKVPGSATGVVRSSTRTGGQGLG